MVQHNALTGSELHIPAEHSAALITSGILAVARGGTGVGDDSYDADKVDGCDAGVATTNVFKIPASLARGDIFFVNASGNLVRLPAGDTGKFLKTQGTAGDPVWEALPGGGDMLQATYDPNTDGIFAIAQGGTGQTTAQAAIDALTQVAGATDEHVFTKDTVTGNATWKAGGGGGVTAHSALSELDYALASHTGFAANPAVTNLDMASNGIIGLGTNVYGYSNSHYMQINGGLASARNGKIVLYGQEYATYLGGVALMVPNATPDAHVEALRIYGKTDTPTVEIMHGLTMNSKKITSLLAGSAAADAVRYDQVLRRAASDFYTNFSVKNPPVGADVLLIEDSTDSWNKKRITVGTLPTGGGGESNTASNTGTVGTGIYKQKTGIDLELYKLYSANNRLTIALNGTDRMDFTINEANINAGQVDGCDAGVTIGDVYKIANVSDGNILIFDKSELGTLTPSTSGYQLTTHGAGVAPSWEKTNATLLTGIVPVANGGTGVADDTYDADKVDGKHATDLVLRDGTNSLTGNWNPDGNGTRKIGDVTHKLAEIWAVDGIFGDLVFEEKECHICKKPFNEGEILSMIVLKMAKNGTHTVPVHSSCIGGDN